MNIDDCINGFMIKSVLLYSNNFRIFILWKKCFR